MKAGMNAQPWPVGGGRRPEGGVSAALRLLRPTAALCGAAAAVGLVCSSVGDDYVSAAAVSCVAALCVLRSRTTAHAQAAWVVLAVALVSLAGARLLGADEVGETCCYALGGSALLLLGRARSRPLSWALLLDGVVTALTLAALAERFPLLNVLLLAFVTVVAVWQGFRPSLDSALVSVGLVAFAVTDVNEFGFLFGTLGIAVASCLSHDPKHDRTAPERWLAIVAPTALSFANVVVLSYGRFSHHLTSSTMFLARLAFLAAFIRVFLSFIATQRMLTNSLRDAASDALTGLPNRRALIADSAKLFVAPTPQHVLAIYDLDGFKQYNDTFGHDDGDTMLSMLGRRLAAAVGSAGCAYRLGGDEFCVITPWNGGDATTRVADLAAALSEEGPGFAIRPSYGAALLPAEASDLTEALRLADRRMYAHKGTRAPEPALELRQR
jgi:diguanylate cyclase (GGDEF)-like protein